MRNINLDLIRKYIQGEDLGDYNIDDLENNKDFMMDVINWTNDMNMYKLCSDNLKKDFDFVKYIILKFKDNKEFIKKVSNYYLSNVNESDETFEINIIMSKLTLEERLNLYKLSCNTVYIFKMGSIQKVLNKNKKVKGIIGMGFLVLFDSYSNNETILNFYAENLVFDILSEIDTNLEDFLHNQFKSKNDINKIGINNYIINLINRYDHMLANYISTHLELIRDLKEEIIFIQSNWDKYNKTVEKLKYLSIFEKVTEYLVLVNSGIDEFNLLYCAATELGIQEKLTKYYFEHIDLNLNREDFNNYLKEELIYVGLDFIKEELKYSFKEQLIYANVKRIIISQLKNEDIDIYELAKNTKSKKAKFNNCKKIIKLDRKCNNCSI